MFANQRILPTICILCAAWISACQSPRATLPASVAASRPAPREYRCLRAAGPIVVDGRLGDPGWQRAAWTEPFVDIRGAGWPAPRHPTRARMAWDDRFFYVAAELIEPHVSAALIQRDAIVFHDNDFEVFIDPDGDRRNYYEIEINALGTIFDLLLVRTYIDGGPARHEWNLTGLRSAVHVDGTLNDPRDADRGWSVEFALPWTTLAEHARCPAPPRPGDVWRVNFSRVEWLYSIRDGRYVKVPDRPEDNWVWSPTGVVNMHLPEHWGFVHFVE